MSGIAFRGMRELSSVGSPDTADSVALGAMRLHKPVAALGASVPGNAGCTRIRETSPGYKGCGSWINPGLAP